MRFPPFLVVMTGVVFVSFSGIFIRLSTAPPMIIASYRMWFTTILLTPLLLQELIRTHRKATPDQQINPESRPRPPIVLLSVVSGVFLSIHFASWTASLGYTSVASSTVLGTTHPIIVAVAGFFILGERLTRRGLLFMTVALGGSVVLVIGGLGDGGSAPLGNLLALIGAVAISGYIVIGRLVRQHLTVRRYTYIVYGVSAILLSSYAIVAGNPLTGYPLRELLLFLALAVVCTLLGHSLFNWALRYIGPSVISTSILGEPVIAGILAVFIIGEAPTLYTLTGGVIILLAIFFFVREARWPKQKR